MLNSKFYKQIDGCSIECSLHVIFFDTYMTKIERKVVEPTKTQFYENLIDDVINKRCKEQPDNLFQALNSNHPKIKYTIKTNPDNFPDTKIITNSLIIYMKTK